MTRLISVVVPTLNEDLARTMLRLDSALDSLDDASAEVLFVDDGPRELRAGQREALAGVARRSTARVVDGPRRGKGAAVRAGVCATKGTVVFTMDADLPVPLEHVAQFARLVDEGADLVMAERPLDREFDTWLRYATSRGLLLIQRAFVFHSGEFRDTQCGFKAFRGELARDIARSQVVDGGMYDLEYIFEAHRRGAKIVKVPVIPNAEIRESRIDIWRCFTRDWIDVVRVRARRGK